MSEEVENQSTIFYWSLILISALSGIINTAVLRMFVKFRKELLPTSAQNRILCSLCFADALVGIFGSILGALLLTGKSSSAYKLAGNIPLFSFMFASVLSLALLTGDRLMAVKRPFVYGTSGYLRKINRLLMAVWCVPLLLIAQQILIFLKISSATELRVRSLFFVVFFCIGSTMLCLTNSMLYYWIRDYSEKRKAMNQRATTVACNAGEVPASVALTQAITVINENKTGHSKPTHNRTQSCVARELRQTSLLCVVIVTSFLLLWTPLAVYRLMYALGATLNLPWLRRMCLCFTISNSLLNPAIYFAFKRKLRLHFLKMFRPQLGRGIAIRDLTKAI